MTRSSSRSWRRCATPAGLSTEEVPGAAARLRDAIARDVAIVAATGRWDGDAPLHPEYVPGDVIGLRMRYAAPALAGAAVMNRLGSAAPPVEATDVLPGLSVAVSLYEAGAYFLPVASGLGIMGSAPPESADLDRLRLPFRTVTVYLGADLVIPDGLLEWPEGSSERFDDSRAMGELVLGGLEEDPAAGGLAMGDSILGDVAARGGYLCGVVLFADAEYRLADVAAFLVAADGETPGPRDRYRGTVVGWLSRSTLAPLVKNIAAAVAWGHWDEPDGELDLPEDVRSSAWQAAVRRGQFRRKEPRGVLAHVHVLDAARMFRSPVRAREDERHASPVAHLRRGFWQRHRIGPRDDWHYEMRFHPPALVNPGGQRVDATTVYRLPLPPTAADGQS